MVTGMKKMKLVFILIAIFLAAGPALAEEQGQLGMLIAQARGDRSMDLLGRIFGDYFAWNTGQMTPLSQMFLTLNTCLWSISVILIIWASVVATVETSHSGEFMGKLHTKWMPIRFVTGIAGVAPLAGGFCLAQVLMYYAAAVGVGAANMVSHHGLQAIIESAANQPIVSSVALSKDSTLQSLLKAQVCAVAYNSQYYTSDGQPLADGVPPAFASHAGEVARADAAIEGIPVVDYRYSYGGTGNYDYAQDYCGGVTIPAGAGGEVDGTLGSLLSQADVRRAHATALSQMAADLWPISRALYYENKKPDPAALAGIRNRYNATVQNVVTSTVTRNSQTMQEILSSNGMTDQRHSWIELGFVFNKLTKVHREIHDAINVVPEPLPALATPNDTAASRAVYGLSLANAFISQSDPSQRSAESAESAESGGKLELLMRKIEFCAIQKALQAFTGGSEDLLTGMTNFGYATLTALFAGLGLILAAGGLLGILSTAAGNAILAWSTLLLLGPLAFAFMCAFYLPMLPMIYWWGGIISWVIVVIEGFVAAPLWMVAHMELGEDSGMGQRSEHGYLFLLNLLFRPVLMVIGLVAGWLASNALGELLKYGIQQWYFSGSGNTSSIPVIGTGLAGITQFFGVIILFGYLGLITLKHCYSLVTVMPDQVLGWIGRTAQSIGGNIEQTVHGDMGGVAGKAGGEVTQVARQRVGPGGGGIKNTDG